MNKAYFTKILFDSGLDLVAEDEQDSVFTFDFEMPKHDKYSEISEHPGSHESM